MSVKRTVQTIAAYTTSDDQVFTCKAKANHWQSQLDLYAFAERVLPAGPIDHDTVANALVENAAEIGKLTAAWLRTELALEVVTKAAAAARGPAEPEPATPPHPVDPPAQTDDSAGAQGDGDGPTEADRTAA